MTRTSAYLPSGPPTGTPKAQPSGPSLGLPQGLQPARRSENTKVPNIFPFRPDFYVAILWQVEKGVYNQI